MDEVVVIMLSCVIFVIVVGVLIYYIGNLSSRRFIQSIQVGDIFVYDNKVNYYYESYQKYKHELNNPFVKPNIVIFPKGTCILREMRVDDNGKTWVAFSSLDTSNDLHRINSLTKHYRTLDEFLDIRERVEKFEL